VNLVEVIERLASIREIAVLPAATPTSIALAKAFKSRGFKFVGPTTAYAHMQTVGVVTDHVVGCEPNNQKKCFK
jgi:DNA-3-methyladenine glycosylase I